MATSVVWTDLPEDVLAVIGKKLVSLKDLVNFSAVCHLWEAVFFQIIRSKSVPALMFQSKKDVSARVKGFYDLCTQSNMSYQCREDLKYNCIGTTLGWVALIDQTDDVLILLDPFTPDKRYVSIPEVFPLPYEDLEEGIIDDIILLEEEEGQDITTMGIIRVCLIDDPAFEPNYVLAATIGTGKEISLWDPMTNAWTSYLCYIEVVSLIFYMKSLFVASRFGRVYVIENFADPTMLIVSYEPNPTAATHSFYLTVLNDELLQIRKTVKAAEDVRFEIFRINVTSGDRTSTKLHVLNGAAIFIGRNTSVSVVSRVPSNCLPDTIYFTDDEIDDSSDDGTPKSNCVKFHEIGSYSFINGMLQMYFPLHLRISHPVPVWVESVRQKLPCQRLPMQPD